MIILETERLYLREHRDEDLNFLFPIFSDAETMKYYKSTFSMYQTQNGIKNNQERYFKDGYGL